MSLNKLMRPNKLVMKITQLILSAYVFSFFFSNSSWPISLLLQCSTNFHFYSFPLQLFSHTIDRKCILILICNGILVFLTSNSSLFSSSSPESYHDINEFPLETQQEVPLEERDQVLVVESNATLENVVVEEEIQDKFIISYGEELTMKLILEGEGGENDKELLETEDGENEEENENFYTTKEEEESVYGVFVEEEQEEEDDDEEEDGDHDQLLSTEQLNKKFDDFIRRMKEEIRTKAQQQLVLVK